MSLEKSEKIVRKITSKTKTATAQIRLQNPNDECYTSRFDIDAELHHYGEMGIFKGKNILCPCDWDIIETDDIYSARFEFSENSEVKCIQYSRFGEEIKITTREEIKHFLREKIKCNFVGLLTSVPEWGIKSITASGYNPVMEQGIPFQDVNFSDYDIVITNPPFSIYPIFMKQLIDSKVDFIVLAPFLNRVTPSVALPLYLRQAFLGYNINKGMSFVNPTPENKYKKHAVAIDWITSFPFAQAERNNNRNRTFIEFEKYKDDYIVMKNMTMKDGTHPLRMTYKTYPDDYFGYAFVPISFLDYMSYDEFDFWPTGIHVYFNSRLDETPVAHIHSQEMIIPEFIPDLETKRKNKTLKSFLIENNYKKKFDGYIVKRKGEHT